MQNVRIKFGWIVFECMKHLNIQIKSPRFENCIHNSTRTRFIMLLTELIFKLLITQFAFLQI